MKQFLFVIVTLSCASNLVAQEVNIFDHKKYVALLGNSKDSLYEKILKEYDQYIKANTHSFQVQLERCRFIEKAYYDYTEDYNPKYEEAVACAKKLVNVFPDTPEVLLYQAENLYGDSLTTYLKKLERKAADVPSIWKGKSWRVYERLANQYDGEIHSEAIHYAELAMTENDTLDLTLLLAKAYKETKRNKKAIDVLITRIDSAQNAWLLNQKGRLLLELNAPDEAIRAFRIASKDSSAWQDSAALAQALIENGLVAEARPYLVKQANGSSWNNAQNQYKLLDFDLEYSSADSAKATYKKFASNDLWIDPFGIARLRLFFKAPLSPITWHDFMRLGMLLICALLVVLLPYAIILPIHYMGYYFGWQNTLNPPARWGLVHLWIAFSFYLLSSVTALLLYDYEYIISIFHSSFRFEGIQDVSLQSAEISVCFFALNTFLTCVFLQKTDFVGLWQKIVSQKTNFLRAFGFVLLLRLGLGVYLVILKSLGWYSSQESLIILSVTDDIVSVNRFMSPWLGFVFVVVLVPLYEEILFRGVFLTACEKHITFLGANILQAFVFSLAHQNLKLFVFYFAFGFLAGHLRRRTDSLAMGISMHIFNNLIAFIAIVVLQRTIEL